MPDTDGFDPYEELERLTYKHTRAMAARALYDRGVINFGGGMAGGMVGDQWHWGSGGGGGGGSLFMHYGDNSNSPDRLIPHLTQMQITPEALRQLKESLQTPEERQEMQWQNPEAADIAREILTDAKREGLREKITEAVAHYREMLEGAHCGSVFSFVKENDEGKHYWYAAIKNGDKWYTTAYSPRVINSDDEFITWLVGLGAHESKASELTVGAAHEALALGPIETTATDGSET